MALLPSEVLRLKAELGFNVLAIGAEPYIGITALFDQVIAPNLTAGAITTSSTGVSTVGAPMSIVVASPVGISAMARVVLDVDDRQETVTVESISGSSITLIPTKIHSGTYPVTVEGGESMVREYLAIIRQTKKQMALAFGNGALKKADEVEFYDLKGKSLFGELGGQLAFWREELAALLGIQSMWNARGRAGQTLSVY